MRTLAAILILTIGLPAHGQTPVDSTQPDAAHPPVTAAPPPDPAGINKALLKFIEDDAPPRSEMENPDEARAYDYVVNYARRVTSEGLQTAARRDIFLAQMLGPEAAKYRGELVHVEGQLKRVHDIGPTRGLVADGMTHLYEAWIVSDVHKGHAYCAVFAELPAGIEVSEKLDQPVSFDGYFYKVFGFRSGDGVRRRAPLLIGRTLLPELPQNIDAAVSPYSGRVLLVVGLVVAGLIMAAGIVIALRLADARTQARLAAARAIGLPPPASFHEPSPFDGSPSWN